MKETPRGTLTTRTLTMPSDTNPAGDIFGGWVLSQMDIAAGICAGERAKSRVVTVALDGMSFIRPVRVGDVMSVYTEITHVGRTSLHIHVEAWALRNRFNELEKVTEAKFSYVALDPDGKPKPIPAEDQP